MNRRRDLAISLWLCSAANALTAVVWTVGSSGDVTSGDTRSLVFLLAASVVFAALGGRAWRSHRQARAILLGGRHAEAEVRAARYTGWRSGLTRQVRLTLRVKPPDGEPFDVVVKEYGPLPDVGDLVPVRIGSAGPDAVMVDWQRTGSVRWARRRRKIAQQRARRRQRERQVRRTG